MQKLSGNAKFELDTKINRYQFFHLLEHLSTDNMSATEALAVASSGTAPADEGSKEAAAAAEASADGTPAPLATEGDEVRVFNEAKY